MDKQFAYSLLTIKSTDERKRTFSGIASTPRPDRENDVVEPRGAVFSLPIPLCWMHDTRDPVGWVQRAKVSDAGIEIEGEVADIAEPPSLKNRLDTAWAMLKGKLVRGLSIGFRPIEYSRMEGGGMRWRSWEWIELSPVTAPANGDCTIDGIKSIDRAARTGRAPAAPDRPAGVLYLKPPEKVLRGTVLRLDGTELQGKGSGGRPVLYVQPVRPIVRLEHPAAAPAPSHGVPDIATLHRLRGGWM